MTRRILVLINPMAGGGAGLELGRRICQQLELQSARVTCRQSAAAGDVALIARAAATEGIDRLAVVGGDGTLHEAINGLMRAADEDGQEHRPELAVIVVGTGNDYAKMLRPKAADPRAWANTLLHAPTRSVDIGQLDGGRRGYFINNVGLGFLADANAATDALHRRRGTRGGKLSYISGGLRALLRHRPVEVSATIDGETIAGPFALLHMAIGRFCGGGVDLTPWARIDDGQLANCLVKARSRWGLAISWPWLERGHGERLSQVIMRSSKSVAINGKPFVIHADGEVMTIADGRLDISLRPAALNVVNGEPEQQREAHHPD